MKVKVTLFSTLRDKLPAEKRGKDTLDLPDGSSLTDLLAALDIRTHVVCAVNGQVETDHNQKLADGDEVRIFRPAGGGSPKSPA